MKKLLLGALLFTGGVFAQSVEPEYEIQGNLIKATYFYDNGNIKEEGFYKDGKVHGKWISYSENGAKMAEGEYINGVKTGNWKFNDDIKSSNVVYVNNRIQNNQSLVIHHK